MLYENTTHYFTCTFKITKKITINYSPFIFNYANVIEITNKMIENKWTIDYIYFLICFLQ